MAHYHLKSSKRIFDLEEKNDFDLDCTVIDSLSSNPWGAVDNSLAEQNIRRIQNCFRF